MTLSCLGKGCAVGFSVGLDGRRYRTAEGQLPPEMAHAGRVAETFVFQHRSGRAQYHSGRPGVGLRTVLTTRVT
jgi:hypothetical protein